MVPDAVRVRTSGCRARNPSGRATPWTWWRSSHTFATDRAAAVSSARSAFSRAAGLSAARCRSWAVSVRSPVSSRYADRALSEVALPASSVTTSSSVESVQPALRQ